jgi:3-phenylpropionate/cinnamic acid dioxygenase small subunit
MFDTLTLMNFNARYARAIDSDALETWPSFFTKDCLYKITTSENQKEGWSAGIIYADSRAMLEDRVTSLRDINIYERQSYRHILGLPLIDRQQADMCECQTPFLVVRIMASGPMNIFASGVYQDRFERSETTLLLSERLVVCDSVEIDTLIALPL